MEKMSTMRHRGEIRSIVEQARQASASQGGRNFDMVYDDTTEDPYHNEQPKIMTQNHLKENIELKKQLHLVKVEADEMKQKYNALKRNYDSVTYHS